MKTIDIKGKPYVTVSERVKAIRKKEGFGVSIVTDIHTITDDYVIIKASLICDGKVISTGFAKEDKGDTFINKGSHIENCETSAIGRCLAFAGYGIDAEIASADEVLNQDVNSTISDTQRITIENMLHDSILSDEMKAKIELEMENMTYSRANDCIEYLGNNLKDVVESGANYNQGDVNRKLDEKLKDERS